MYARFRFTVASGCYEVMVDKRLSGSKAPAELKMESPPVRAPVGGEDVVGAEAVIEPDRIDQQSRPEAVRPFHVGEIRVVEIGKDVSAFGEAQEVDRDRIERYRKADFEGLFFHDAPARRPGVVPGPYALVVISAERGGGCEAESRPAHVKVVDGGNLQIVRERIDVSEGGGGIRHEPAGAEEGRVPLGIEEPFVVADISGENRPARALFLHL